MGGLYKSGEFMMKDTSFLMVIKKMPAFHAVAAVVMKSLSISYIAFSLTSCTI